MKGFGIRDDYQPNTDVLSNDAESGLTYWTAERIALSRRYQWPVYRLAHDVARKSDARVIVDVGCGVATKLNAVFGPKYDIYGIDQQSAVEACRSLHTRGTYLAEDFDRPTKQILGLVPRVDMVISSDVIEHLVDPDALLVYIRAIASPTTPVVISTPERVALHGADCVRPRNPAHIREWSRAEFRTYIEASGFAVVEHRTVLPFSLRMDRMTVHHLLGQLRRRRSLRTSQVVVATCR